MTLQCELDGIKAQLLAVLGAEDRQALEDAIERLRMLQLVEQGLSVGDVLPDFTLPDIGGRDGGEREPAGQQARSRSCSSAAPGAPTAA